MNYNSKKKAILKNNKEGQRDGLTCKSGSLSPILKIYIKMERENQLHKAVLWLAYISEL